MKMYKKPIVTVDAGLAEGVYAASGVSRGTLNVTYHGVWDRWGTNGGKGLAMADWSGIDGTITLNVTFNDTVDQAETSDASVNASCSGNTATFTFASTAENPLTLGIHLNHGTSIDDLKMTGFTYSVK
ncbi:MAG: hypothetical protein Q4P27_08235 [Eubacteriales bacterium]|nr:hypothetical protein [Eubacteriales bacterium]